MRLFSFGKKKEKTSCCSCCQEKCETLKDEATANNIAKEPGIKVLGSGCKKCSTLEKNVKDALCMLNLQEKVAHVKDFAEIAGYGVLTTPALVIDGEVVVTGRVPEEKELRSLIQQFRS